MTEAEWLAATDPTPVLAFLWGTASDRKLRLFLCGCVRHALRRPSDEPVRHLVGVIEVAADSSTPATDIPAARAEAVRLQAEVDGWLLGRRFETPETPSYEVASALLLMTLYPLPVEVARDIPPSLARTIRSTLRRWREVESQAALLRDIFGNPFCPITPNPSWLTSTVVAISEGIYTDRAFDRLPILADALQDAGCDNSDVLDHCHSDGPHVRGCWVVDLVLGKE
jgi:hypothetical protein